MVCSQILSVAIIFLVPILFEKFCDTYDFGPQPEYEKPSGRDLSRNLLKQIEPWDPRLLEFLC